MRVSDHAILPLPRGVCRLEFVGLAPRRRKFDGGYRSMNRKLQIPGWFVLATLIFVSACEEKESRSDAPRATAPSPEREGVDPAPAEKEAVPPALRGAADLEPLPSAVERDRAERDEKEPPPGNTRARRLTLEVVLHPGRVTGQGTFGEEQVDVTGSVEGDTLRLVVSGSDTRGTLVAEKHDGSNARSGEVRLSTTQMQATSTIVQSYSGKLALNPVD